MATGQVIGAEEYLRTHLNEQYQSRPATLPILSTKDRPCSFQLNGKLYCSGFMSVKGNWYAFIQDNSIDGVIISKLPHSIQYIIDYPKIWKLVKWIQEKIFDYQIETAENSQIKTKLVRLRIADNSIMKADYIKREDRMQWAVWVKELFWQREKLLHEWYMKYVLPF